MSIIFTNFICDYFPLSFLYRELLSTGIESCAVVGLIIKEMVLPIPKSGHIKDLVQRFGKNRCFCVSQFVVQVFEPLVG